MLRGGFRFPQEDVTAAAVAPNEAMWGWTFDPAVVAWSGLRGRSQDRDDDR